jgi:hypothetical protein
MQGGLLRWSRGRLVESLVVATAKISRGKPPSHENRHDGERLTLVGGSRAVNRPPTKIVTVLRVDLGGRPSRGEPPSHENHHGVEDLALVGGSRAVNRPPTKITTVLRI